MMLTSSSIGRTHPFLLRLGNLYHGLTGGSYYIVVTMLVKSREEILERPQRHTYHMWFNEHYNNQCHGKKVNSHGGGLGLVYGGNYILSPIYELSGSRQAFIFHSCLSNFRKLRWQKFPKWKLMKQLFCQFRYIYVARIFIIFPGIVFFNKLKHGFFIIWLLRYTLKCACNCWNSRCSLQ